MKPAVRKNWKKWSLWIVGLVALAVAVFLGAAQLARTDLARKNPPPGQIITLADGRGLHVICEGQGKTVVLLEAGLNEFSVHWNLVQPLLSRDTKVCAYDRAGLGWSDLGTRAPTLENRVSDLEQLVQHIADQQPLIVVGHSFGSFLVRLYAQRNPQFVKAIVLLDPASEWMAERIDGYATAINTAVHQFEQLQPIARLGLIALSKDEIPAGYLSGTALQHYRSSLAAGHFFEGAATETGEMLNNIRKMQGIEQDELAKIAVVVISRGKPDPIPGLTESGAQHLETTWAALQQDLVKRLHAKQLIAAHSGHSINLQQPEIVAGTVRNYLDNKPSAR